MNKVILIGNLTRDIKAGKADNGTMYSKFDLAVNRSYKNDKGERPTDFVSIIAFRELAELALKYLGKGDKICVTGELRLSSYENKEGQKVYSSEVVADSLEFLTPPKRKDSDIHGKKE